MQTSVSPQKLSVKIFYRIVELGCHISSWGNSGGPIVPHPCSESQTHDGLSGFGLKTQDARQQSHIPTNA